MAIKAGTFIHDAQGYVLDRIQTGGVSSLNIPQEKIYELGNYQTVATIFDIPDLSFDVESTDVSCETEALIHGKVPTAVVSGDVFNYGTTYPLDIISPFKAGNGAFNIVKGIVVPYLTLDTVNYKFGVKANATETFTFKGDSVYYVPGSPYYQQFNLVASGPYNFTNPAIPYTESGNTLYALSACVKNLSTGAFQRLFFGTGTNGYSNTSSSITTNTNWAAAGYTTLHVTYGSLVAATYNQSVNAVASSVKPAAIRSKDILLYVGNANSPTIANLTKWSGVQSFDVTRKVNLQSDEEFGNSKYVSTDYDTADVTGSISVRSADAASLWTLIEQVTGTSAGAISGPLNNPTLEIELQVRDPSTGTILKSWSIPDARFTVPAIQGKVQTKVDATFNFTSDAGLLSVYQNTNA